MVQLEFLPAGQRSECEGMEDRRKVRVRKELNQNLFQQIHAAVRRVPRGKVTSYGDIARIVGLPNGARQVGWALRALHDDPSVPWHRVINRRGRISLPGRSGDLQRALLEAEGVQFDSQGRIDLDRFAWDVK